MLIPIKEKQCKGSDSRTRGLGCGKPTFHRKLGLGLMCGCYSEFILHTTAGREIMSKAMLKASAPRLQKEKNDKELAEGEKFKKDRDKLNYLLVNVRTACHEYIRKRDEFKPCISCGISYNDNFQAGHFFKAQLFSNLKFNENNIHGQCKKCNMFDDGNESGYRVGLMQRYGKEYLAKINDLAGDSKKNDYHWDREELEQLRVYYKQKLKEIS